MQCTVLEVRFGNEFSESMTILTLLKFHATFVFWHMVIYNTLCMVLVALFITNAMLDRCDIHNWSYPYHTVTKESLWLDCSACTTENSHCYSIYSWCLWHQVTLSAMQFSMSIFSASSQGYFTIRAVSKRYSYQVFLARKTLLIIEYIMYLSAWLSLNVRKIRFILANESCLIFLALDHVLW